MDGDELPGLAGQILARRLQGSSWSTIAEQFGMDAGHVAEFVMDALLSTPKVSAEVEVRLDLERLDALFVGVYKPGKRGDTSAVGQALKILELRSKRLQQLAELEAGTPAAPDVDADAPAAPVEPESPAAALARIKRREAAAVSASRGSAALHLIRGDDEGNEDDDDE